MYKDLIGCNIKPLRGTNQKVRQKTNEHLNTIFDHFWKPIAFQIFDVTEAKESGEAEIKEGDITRKATSQGRRHHKEGDITREATSQGR